MLMMPVMLDSRRVSAAALLLLPAGLMAYFAFNAGGFYPAPVAFVAVVLALLLVFRATGSTRPFEGAGWMLGAVAALLGLFALLTLLSASWSHNPGDALASFDRVLVYLLVIVLFGTVPHSRLRLVWVLRALALAIFVVCGCALVTRLLPNVWPTAPGYINSRLSFPITYWNVLGLLAVMGIVLCVHFTSDEREPAGSRIAMAAAVPVLATTLLFTFSRGSIAVCVIALVVYALVGRPRGLISAVGAIGPATAVAVTAAYDANLLATSNPAALSARPQGHHVAVVVVACVCGAAAIRAVLSILLDPRLGRVTIPARHRRRTTLGGWSAVAAITVVAIIALSATISRDYHRFLRPLGNHSVDLRARLTDPSNNGRLEMWRIAWHEFKAAPVAGNGAGTYADTFLRHRTDNQFVVNAHSLYMETLDELGLVGLVLLLAVILAILVRTASRARGPNRALYAAVFALLLAWALETGIDWDWQMPVVTTIFVAVGGIMLARRAPESSSATVDTQGGADRRRGLSPPARAAIGIGCLLLAVTPAYVWLSQRKLNQATTAFSAGDCRAASDDALSSISILGVQPQAYEVVAYCDIHRDLPNLAIKAMNHAVSLAPQNWNYAYGLALARAAAGLNPLGEAHRALQLDPREQLVRVEWQTFRADTPSEWPADGRTLADAFTSL
jgi:O-antigen ligase